jgi:hypothetical protein
MPFRPDEFPLFTPLDRATIEGHIAKVSGILGDFVTQTGITDIAVHDRALYEIIERIEKRRVYFHIFYNGCKMGELNEAAFLCFWILKLTPFYSLTMPSHTLNTKIAVYLFGKILAFTAKRMNKPVRLSKQIIDDLFYAFSFRDLSKEAIMLIAETLMS